MAPKLAELRNLTDEQLVQRYDNIAESTVVGTSFYADELNRRAYQRAMDAALEEARAARRLARTNMWVAIVAAVVAVLAIVV